MPGHALHPQGQNNGDNCRQPFGDGRHGQTDRGEEHRQELMSPQYAQSKNKGTKQNSEYAEPAAEVVQLLLQRGFLQRRLLDHPGNLADCGVHPCGGD